MIDDTIVHLFCCLFCYTCHTVGEYLSTARQYPGGAHIKIIRNHMMKFLYRYFVKFIDLRNETAACHTIEGFEKVVDDLRRVVLDVGEDCTYTEVGVG